VEGHHARLYKGMIEGRTADYYVCQICGYISENEIPENCPVCGAVKTRFKAVVG
jgi:rubrerythrin